jgi:hypothetical protein
MQVTIKNFKTQIWRLTPESRKRVLHKLFTLYLSPGSIRRLEKIETAYWKNRQNWSHEKYAKIQNKAIIRILAEETSVWGTEIRAALRMPKLDPSLIILEVA